MAKNKQANRRRRRHRHRNNTTTQNSANFVATAGRGCFIARREDAENDWLLEWQDGVYKENFGCEDIPDVALDPNDETLTFCNVDGITKVAYVTIYSTQCKGKLGQPLQQGTTTDNEGNTQSCTTFIILCPPNTFCHFCTLDLKEDESITDVKIDSDVQPYSPHPNPNDSHPLLLDFPLEGGPFLCTQSQGGYLTHFFAGNLHALDFRCDIGTPLLAVANGIVRQVRTHNTHLTGIAVSNLFEWNSILMEITEETTEKQPLFVEYVHIASACVKEGEEVSRGQVIGKSGSVGFSPEPHLHISAFASREATAATVQVKFVSSFSEKEFLPVAGMWYTNDGQVDAPQDTS